MDNGPPTNKRMELFPGAKGAALTAGESVQRAPPPTCMQTSRGDARETPFGWSSLCSAAGAPPSSRVRGADPLACVFYCGASPLRQQPLRPGGGRRALGLRWAPLAQASLGKGSGVSSAAPVGGSEFGSAGGPPPGGRTGGPSWCRPGDAGTGEPVSSEVSPIHGCGHILSLRCCCKGTELVFYPYSTSAA